MLNNFSLPILICFSMMIAGCTENGGSRPKLRTSLQHLSYQGNKIRKKKLKRRNKAETASFCSKNTSNKKIKKRIVSSQRFKRTTIARRNKQDIEMKNKIFRNKFISKAVKPNLRNIKFSPAKKDFKERTETFLRYKAKIKNKYFNDKKQMNILIQRKKYELFSKGNMKYKE